MYRQLIINVTEHETRVALLEDGTIVELFIKRKDDSDIVGNIYKGRVQRVLPGMQAAFVDVGLNQAAFIYVNDVLSDSRGEYEKLFIRKEEDEHKSAEISTDEPVSAKRDQHIEDLLTEGQEIMVQVAKSPIGTKGSRVTSHISLPGRFLVLMPTSGHIGISRRIEDEVEKDRLRDMILSLKEDDMGYIVRTAAEGIQEEKLLYEMNFLKNLWENIQEKTGNRQCPRFCTGNSQCRFAQSGTSCCMKLRNWSLTHAPDMSPYSHFWIRSCRNSGIRWNSMTDRNRFLTHTIWKGIFPAH